MTSPYSTYSANIVVIAEALMTRIQLGMSTPGTFTVVPVDLFFGDQNKVPHSPTVCVEPGEKNRTIQGAPDMTLNEFEIYILVYANSVTELQDQRRVCDQLAYELEKWIHGDLQLLAGGSDPHLIHGFVRSNESGYTYRNNTLYRSARLTYYGKNKTSLSIS